MKYLHNKLAFAGWLLCLLPLASSHAADSIVAGEVEAEITGTLVTAQHCEDTLTTFGGQVVGSYIMSWNDWPKTILTRHDFTLTLDSSYDTDNCNYALTLATTGTGQFTGSLQFPSQALVIGPNINQLRINPTAYNNNNFTTGAIEKNTFTLTVTTSPIT